ncbi:MAG: S41 family peptidase [Candidatus Omnitrophica bacterium]|nr:S41 family peptidase [Candidatus Omnitrophota bacterium]
MKKRIIGSVILAFLLLASVFSHAKDVNIVDDSKELFKQIQLFADSITLISADYVEPVSVKDLVYGAIKGMMATLGGYNQFLDPESFKEITEETKGEFGGLGVSVGMRDGVLTVISPMEDTPAYTAGIKSGDKIVKIDDEITKDMPFDEAIKKMRGNPGTKVKLTIIREGENKILEFLLARAVIKLQSIKESRIFDKSIGYIRIIEFQEKTTKDLAQNIIELRNKGAKDIVLDLRNNPGGLLSAAIEVSDLFLPIETMIVYTEGRNPEKRMEFRAKKESKFDDMDMVLIVDNGSASAAEIFAGALKDNKRALIIGVPTFGKGSVQTVIPLEDKSALRLTTADYYTPSGKNLRNKGIEPDVYVEKMSLIPETFQEDQEEIKTKVFEKLDGKNPPKIEDKVKYDNQVQTAVSILKGIKIFEKHKTDG